MRFAIIACCNDRPALPDARDASRESPVHRNDD
jgi:hypothetical protein